MQTCYYHDTTFLTPSRVQILLPFLLPLDSFKKNAVSQSRGFVGAQDLFDSSNVTAEPQTRFMAALIVIRLFVCVVSVVDVSADNP